MEEVKKEKVQKRKKNTKGGKKKKVEHRSRNK